MGWPWPGCNWLFSHPPLRLVLQELFNSVLCAPCWPVAQAAMRSLVRFCRTTRTSALAQLVPVGMRTADGVSASSQFLQVYASHMKGEPDAQVPEAARGARGLTLHLLPWPLLQ
jgi:hypothetical protein